MATKLTEHFTLEEMTFSATAARHGISNLPVDDKIHANIMKSAEFLEALRAKLGKPIRVLSCYRSPAVNKLVGGSTTSAHMKGLAVDIQVPGMTIEDLSHFVKKNFQYDQLILEFPPGGWVHVGIKVDGHARMQDLTAVKVAGKTVYEHGIA